VSPAVEQIRQTVEARIRELQPVITELEQLEGILALLDEGTAVHQLPNISALLTRAQAETPTLAPALDRPPAAVEPLIRRGRRGTKPGRDGRAPQGANKQLIIATILQRPGISAPEIAQLTGLKRTVVSATINRLKRGGELEPYGRGVRVPLAPPSAVA
jgi:Winged helix-turn-helix DNA-binding